MIVEHDNDNAYIALLIKAAVERFEEVTGRQLLDATFDQFFDAFPTPMKLAYPPLDSVTSVKYYDTAGAQQTLTVDDDYQVDDAGEVASIWPGRTNTVWPSTEPERINAVEVRFVAGYGEAADIPERYKHAIKELVAEWYDRRLPASSCKVVKLPFHLQAILNSAKVSSW